MAVVHKISKDFYDDSFKLIALHSSLEDYAAAYAINKYLKSSLQRPRMDLDISENVSFPFFEWKDLINDKYWTLITNTSMGESDLDQNGLFRDETSYTVHYLVSEYKEVDYFLKIEQDDLDVTEDLVKSLLAIPEMITAYTIETNTLKSKQNLIF
ncbi:IPExxxVDY family protein [Spongiimicrobium sp. 3-5]|uniref:IPExxxVDY family protein n=1 Tax=Spongiimicrobium sp. 3-5 TaxID=3332596 RepID=UPI00397F443D